MLLHRVSVGKLDLGAGSIDRQTRDEVTRHLIDLLLEQEPLVLRNSREGMALRRDAAGVHRGPLAIRRGERGISNLGATQVQQLVVGDLTGGPIGRPEAADRVERLEGEPGRVDQPVATRTHWAGAMRVQLLPNRRRTAGVRFQPRDVDRRKAAVVPAGPSRLASTKLPRGTGDVVVPLAVILWMLAWVSNPPRGLSAGSITLRICCPSMPADTVVLGQAAIHEGEVGVN